MYLFKPFSVLLVVVLFTSVSCVKKQEAISMGNCNYMVRDTNSQKTITCKSIISREQCGLFLKDCDQGLTGINCATNVSYYCR